MHRIPAAFLIALTCVCARAQDFARPKQLTKDLDVSVVPQMRKDKWGYANDKGKFVIKPVFDAAEEFKTYQSSDGAPFECALVKSGGKWGVLRRDATYYVEPVLDTVLLRHDNDFAIFVKNGRYGLLRFDDMSFDPFVIPAVYARIDTLTQYGGYFLRSATHSGYCDEFGRTVVKVTYRKLEESGQFLKATSDAGLCGLLSLSNEEILPTKFRSIEEGPDNRYLVVESSDGRYGCYSNTGEEVIPPMLESPPVNELKFKALPGARVEFRQNAFPHEFYSFEKHGDEYLLRFVLPITSLGCAFAGHTEIVSVTLPDCIMQYNPFEFKNCTSLMSVGLLPGITDLPEGMFSGCISLIDVDLPEGVRRIPDRFFENCESLEQVQLPSGVNAVGAGAFRGCSYLEEIHTRALIYELGEDSFRDCLRLSTLPRLTELRSLGARAFMNCTLLEKFDVPEGITAIAPDTFRGCDNLEEISFSRNLSTIGEGAFKGCYMLRSIELPESLVNLEKMALCNTGLTEVYLPDSVQVIGERALEIISLQSASLDSKFKSAAKFIFGSAFPEITWRSDYEPEAEPELLPEAVPEAEPEIDLEIPEE